MTGFYIGWMILLAIVMIVWIFLMIRMLTRLTRQSMRALDQTGGGYFTWVGHSLTAFGGFWSDPSVATERRQLIWVTILLMLIVVGGPLLAVR